jgi:hypothetical protein
MTDQGPLGRPPRGASVPGGAPCGAGPQLMDDKMLMEKVPDKEKKACDRGGGESHQAWRRQLR